MEGAGNDFILINVSRVQLRSEPGSLARDLCRRHWSVGADGLILVGPSDRPDVDVRFRFWNPDGSEIVTCGNGTRCAARFAILEGLAPEEMVIETGGGDIRARVSREGVALSFSEKPTYDLARSVVADGAVHEGHFFDVGNQHFVIEMSELPEGAIEPICRPIRYASELGPAGANVNLVSVVDRHRIRIRTYERGVEAETLACGSGSMSSAAALAAAGRVESPVEVETRSGDVLTIRFRRDGDGGFKDMEMEGPARVVYWGSLKDEDEDEDRR